MRKPTPQQELAALRDHVARILSAGCPETARLPERAWTLVLQALNAVTEQKAATEARPRARRAA